ncbi:hypothetical protein [Hymenobacter terricola]|uniref:hypothetical protein n=1 Tax=Hymenobacter terricola TaxID=2819236 RepID=UPI001B307098|nr:hypothetical protein [Hymenobacter terricola]
MTKSSLILLLAAGSALAACQSTPKADTTSGAPVEAAQTPPASAQPGLKTEAEARTAVAQYIQTQPNAALYIPDSARVNDNGATWQVLVPRTDWAGRMPNRARFEVDKATGTVNTGTVK